MPNDTPNLTDAKFELGQQVATTAALKVVHGAGQSVLGLLARHAAGDWSDLGDEDRRLNDASLTDESKLFSAYALTTGEHVWGIPGTVVGVPALFARVAKLETEKLRLVPVQEGLPYALYSGYVAHFFYFALVTATAPCRVPAESQPARKSADEFSRPALCAATPPA